MKLFILLIALMSSISVSASGFPYTRENRDLKLVSQKLIEYQLISNPNVASSVNMLSGQDGPDSAAASTVSTFLAQPDVPRNIVITPVGTTADVATCVAVLSGTDIHGQAITENFSFVANQATSATGTKAFATVTSLVFPALCEDTPFGATWNAGYSEKLGLKRCLAQDGHILFSTLDGAKEATAPTISSSSTVVSENTADFNGAMDGTSDFELMFIQNFRPSCFP